MDIFTESNITGAFLLACHVLGYVTIIGSISAMVIKLVHCRTHDSEMGILGGTERTITLLCCATFVLIGVSIVVFFNSI